MTQKEITIKRIAGFLYDRIDTYGLYARHQLTQLDFLKKQCHVDQPSIEKLIELELDNLLRKE